MKILIVDDNELMRQTIRALLTDLGHEVAGEAEDGEGALKAYAALRPEVVFLDLVMPGKSGVEVLQDLRALDPRARVVISTAVAQDELDRKLLKKGAAAIIHKPFSCEELREVVGRVVQTL